MKIDRLTIKLLVSATVALLPALSASICSADDSFSKEILSQEDLTPATVRVSTPSYEPDLEKYALPLGTYTFKVGWQGIPAATLTLTTERQGLYYRVLATAKTYSGIDLFYKLRYRAEGLLSAFDLQPVKTTINQTENSKEKLTEITYLDGGKVHALRQTKGKEAETLEFDPSNSMLEPFSAAFIARSLPWEIGTSRKFDTFNGKTRYLITLSCIDKTTLSVNGEERPVFVIEPSVENLTSKKPASKLKEARIYVSADERRDILKLSSEVFIGSVGAWLDSFEPSATTTIVAKQNEKDNFVK